MLVGGSYVIARIYRSNECDGDRAFVRAGGWAASHVKSGPAGWKAERWMGV